MMMAEMVIGGTVVVMVVVVGKGRDGYCWKKRIGLWGG